MQIVLKSFPGRERDLTKALLDAISDLCGQRVADQVQVRPVFPAGTPGNRGRLFTAELPDIVHPSDVEELLRVLMKGRVVESAGKPSPRSPL